MYNTRECVVQIIDISVVDVDASDVVDDRLVVGHVDMYSYEEYIYPAFVPMALMHFKLVACTSFFLCRPPCKAL